MADKPDIEDARWAEWADGTPASSSNIQEPDADLKDEGWAFGANAASKFDNWIKRELYRWAKYLDELAVGDIAPSPKPDVVGSCLGNPALASLIAALHDMGVINSLAILGAIPPATEIAAGASAAGDLSIGGRLLMADGTQALPAVSFTNDPDTGIWRDATGVRIGKDNAVGATIKAGQILATDGTQALPAVSFASDPDTGIWRDATGVRIGKDNAIGATIAAGQLLATDGTQALPAVSFASDPDTGIWRDATGVRIGKDNAIGATIAAGQLLAPDGSAAAPALSFAADPDTGLYRSSANTLATASNGLFATSLSGSGFNAQGILDVSMTSLRVAPRTVKTVDYAVQAGDCAIIMKVTAGGTLTLEAAPIDGKIIMIRNQSANALTIDRNGKTIDDAASNLNLAAGDHVTMIYHAITGSWYRTSGGARTNQLSSSRRFVTGETVLTTDCVLIAPYSSGVNQELTLPAAPAPLQTLFIKNCLGSTLTLHRNGNQINEGVSDLVLASGAAYIMQFFPGWSWYGLSAT